MKDGKRVITLKLTFYADLFETRQYLRPKKSFALKKTPQQISDFLSVSLDLEHVHNLYLDLLVILFTC